MRRCWTLLALAALAASSTGCLLAGNYHSARTLDKGTSSFGMTFSMTTFENTTTDSSTGTTDVDRVTIPNLIPELAYHIGVTDDTEVGGRVSLGALGLEADVKYRFYRSDKLHLAVAPAVSYQAFVILQGVGLRVPGVLTYEISDHLAFNAAVFFTTTRYEATDSDVGTDSLLGTLGSTGAAVGFDIVTETFVIRPSVEFTEYLWEFGGDDDFERFNTVNVLVHLAWIGGTEKKQLNRIERKIDRITPAGEPPVEDDSPYDPATEPIR